MPELRVRILGYPHEFWHPQFFTRISWGYCKYYNFLLICYYTLVWNKYLLFKFENYVKNNNITWRNTKREWGRRCSPRINKIIIINCSIPKNIVHIDKCQSHGWHWGKYVRHLSKMCNKTGPVLLHIVDSDLDTH